MSKIRKKTDEEKEAEKEIKGEEIWEDDPFSDDGDDDLAERE